MDDKQPPFYHGYAIHDQMDISIEADIIDFPFKSAKVCQHVNVRIDESDMELYCKDCRSKVNPVMWIKDHLSFFSRIRENALEKSRKAKEDYSELEKRAKTKCDHCKKMTGIKLKNFKFRVVE